jgi:hypothetical protein
VVESAAHLDEQPRLSVLLQRRHALERLAVLPEKLGVERGVPEQELALLRVSAGGVAVQAGPLADLGPDLVGKERLRFAAPGLAGGGQDGRVFREKGRADGGLLDPASGEQNRRSEKKKKPDEAPARHAHPLWDLLQLCPDRPKCGFRHECSRSRKGTLQGIGNSDS